MNKFIMLMLMLLFKVEMSYSMNDLKVNPHSYVKLYTADMLLYSFHEMMLDDFYLKSTNIMQMADQTVSICHFLHEVDNALTNYGTLHPKSATFIQELLPEILEILLEDSALKHQTIKIVKRALSLDIKTR